MFIIGFHNYYNLLFNRDNSFPVIFYILVFNEIIYAIPAQKPLHGQDTTCDAIMVQVRQRLLCDVMHVMRSNRYAVPMVTDQRRLCTSRNCGNYFRGLTTKLLKANV